MRTLRPLTHIMIDNTSKKALVQSSHATREHRPEYRAIELSTHGIIFLGTPHQGTESVDLALVFLQIQSIYANTNNRVMKHLTRDSEALQALVSRYAAISGHFDTKFFFEEFPTRLPGGMKRVASRIVALL